MTRRDFRPRSLLAAVVGGLCLDVGSRSPEAVRNTVLLAGSARSGTTWAAAMISDVLKARLVFEPFFPEKVPAFRHLDRKPRIEPDSQNEPYEEAARLAFSGRLYSGWSDRHNRRIFARRRLVKEVRANLMLGWLAQRFPEMKIVFMQRHPLAVAASRQRLGWPDGLDDIARKLSPADECCGLLSGMIPAARTYRERAALAWCAENHIALRETQDVQRFHLMTYENLLLDPETELRRIARLAGIKDIPERKLHKICLSNAADRKFPEPGGEVPGDEIARVGEMLVAFGLDSVYDPHSGLPVPVAPGR